MTILVLAAVCAAYLAFYWVTPWGVPPLRRRAGGFDPPDLRCFGYSGDEVYRLLALYGPAGVTHWRRLLYLDMGFPPVYCTLCVLLVSRWADWAHAGTSLRLLALVAPFAAAAADYVENGRLLRVVATLPRRVDGDVAVASVATTVKFAALLATLVVPLIGTLVLRVF